MKFALVTYKWLKKLSPSDQILAKVLDKRGHEVTAVVWDDPKVAWQAYDQVILRSTWDYFEHLERFNKWLHILEDKQVSVWNPPEVVRWNQHKRYLLELKRQGIAIVPTIMIEKEVPLQASVMATSMGWDEVVVKPAASVMAIGVKRFRTSQAQQMDTYVRKLQRRGAVLVQTFMEEVHSGEYSLVYFNKVFSHAVLKKPKAGEYRANPGWGVKKALVEVDGTIRQAADRVIGRIKKPCLYARVDGVIRDGSFYLMELELIEPHLFFDLYPKGAENMTDAIEEIIQAKTQ